MSIQRLKKELEETVRTFNEEINFMLETFDQSHEDKHLTKQDMEDMSRQAFYAMDGFKDSIITYLKELDR